MKKVLFLLVIFQFSVIAQTKTEKYHRAKITYASIENLKRLQQLGVPMDHGFHKKGYSLTSDFSDSEITIARNLNLQVEIEINDVQKYYIDQNKNPQPASPENTTCNSTTKVYPTPVNFNLGSMGGYLTYAQMLQELDDMRTLFPTLISAKENVGTFLTSENRALQWVKITKDVAIPNSKPQILYDAVHHAREPISLSQTIFYMWYLLENYETNEEVRNIVDNTEMYFIPVINPDGYVYNETTNPNGGGMWRKNRRSFTDGTFGVDNNRNYDYWKDGDINQSIWNTLGVSATTTGESYPGTTAFSEPENQAIKFFVETHNFKIALNAHTFSNLLLYPYGYDLNVPSPDDFLLNKITGLLVKESGFTNEIASALYAASGDSDDFMYGQTQNHSKILAFTPEIGSSFWPPITDIIPLCNQMMFTNLTAAKLLLDFAEVKDKSPEYIGATSTFQANFSMTKFGLSGSGNYTISVNPISSNIIYIGAPFTLNNATPLEEIDGTIQLGLASNSVSGDSIIYELVVDNGLTQERKLITKKFGQFQTILFNDCSSLSPTWSNSINSWATTTEAFVSPATSITDSPNANYLSNQTKIISLVNPINLTGLPIARITFSAKWDLENNFDYVQFQVSPNNGTTWISQCGKYTNLASTSTGQPAGLLYDGNKSEWVKEEIDLSDYANQTIKVRFRFKSDGFSEFDGFYFDDFKVESLQTSSLNVSKSKFSKFEIYPNPASSKLNINTLQNNYDLSIFSIQGQIIFQKLNNNGFQTIDTSLLSKGIYTVELKSDGIIETKKLIKD